MIIVAAEDKYLRQVVLLGNLDTKRTNYVRQAAEWAKLPVFFVDWKDFAQWKEQLQQTEYLLKIDPPLWESCSLMQLESLTADYLGKLEELSRLEEEYRIQFFNHPKVIAQLLDKRMCKRRLEQEGLAVTELVEDVDPAGGIRSAGQLLELLKCRNISQVFIKPVYGSGAAGVAAFRWQPSTGRMVLYSCAWEHPIHGLVNTKRLRQFSKTGEVISLLDQILKMDCVIERWYAKDTYQGHSYDLRAVVLDGSVDFILARLSKGPITNLHLNNRSAAVSELGLSAGVLEDISRLCNRAMACFPGLRSAGIDVLLERGSRKPRIIELNAQGDLIYQDIFAQNRIYRHQVQCMKEWQCRGVTKE